MGVPACGHVLKRSPPAGCLLRREQFRHAFVIFAASVLSVNFGVGCGRRARIIRRKSKKSRIMLGTPMPKVSRDVFQLIPGYNFTGTIQTTDSGTCAVALSRLTNLKSS
jgi:hypothetical protein